MPRSDLNGLSKDQTPTTPKKPSCAVTILLPILAAICLGTLFGLNYVLGLPQKAAQLFGPSEPSLTTLNRLRLSAMLLAQVDGLTNPVNTAGSQQAFEVMIGESIPSVTGRLWEAGLISNPGVFRTYLLYTGLDKTLQAGIYTLSPTMSPLEIAQKLQDATPLEVPFQVLAGWRVEEIAEAMPTSGLRITTDEFLAVAMATPTRVNLRLNLPPDATLEGFLFPGTYSFKRDLTALEIITQMVDNFEASIGPELRSAFSRQGISIYEAVTLASIVEREAVRKEESPLIASVFYNRLEIGMKLDADPTVQYALGFNPVQGTWWTNPISLTDLEIDSPYNTYRYPGLPPGPIANPSMDSLRAVGFPAQTPYYYFRAACDASGNHVFSRTFEEHKAKGCP